MSGVSNHYDAMVAIKAVIDGLGLQGLSSTGTIIQEVFNYDPNRNDQALLPFISISPFGAETSTDDNNAEDDCGYPVLIAILANPDPSKLEERLGWRQSIRREMRNRDFGLQGNFNVIPELQNVVDVAAWKSKYYFSALIARVWFEEVR